jgi:hypothetical protein
MEILAIAPLTRSGFTSFVALPLFEVVVTADFLNNPLLSLSAENNLGWL